VTGKEGKRRFFRSSDPGCESGCCGLPADSAAAIRRIARLGSVTSDAVHAVIKSIGLCHAHTHTHTHAHTYARPNPFRPNSVYCRLSRPVAAAAAASSVPITRKTSGGDTKRSTQQTSADATNRSPTISVPRAPLHSLHLSRSVTITVQPKVAQIRLYRPITTYQPDTKSNPNPNPNPNPTTKPHTIVSRILYGTAEVSIGNFGTSAEMSWVRNVLGPKYPYNTCPTYPEKLIRDCVVAPSV